MSAQRKRILAAAVREAVRLLEDVADEAEPREASALLWAAASTAAVAAKMCDDEAASRERGEDTITVSEKLTNICDPFNVLGDTIAGKGGVGRNGDPA